jgi:hypothetical protein
MLTLVISARAATPPGAQRYAELALALAARGGVWERPMIEARGWVSGVKR